MQSGDSQEKGYTLIELSVVVLLIGMMLVLSVPRIRDAVTTDDLKATARRLAGAARQLKNDSLREQVDWFIRFDLDHPGFWIAAADMTPEKLAEIQKNATRFPEGMKIADISRPGREKQTEGEAAIRFHRQGHVDPAVLHLTRDDRTLTLVFQPFLNSVEIYEGYLDFTFNEEGLTRSR